MLCFMATAQSDPLSPAELGHRRVWRIWRPGDRLKVGDQFVHESIIGSRFIGRVQQTVDLGGTTAIIP